MRIFAMVALLAVFAAAASGCGPGKSRSREPLSKDTYEQRMSGVREKRKAAWAKARAVHKSAFSSSARSTPAEPWRRLARGDRMFAAAAGRAREQLDSIAPPTEIESIHDQLTDAYAEHADELERSAEAAARRDREAYATASQKPLSSLTRISGLERSISARGYRIRGG